MAALILRLRPVATGLGSGSLALICPSTGLRTLGLGRARRGGMLGRMASERSFALRPSPSTPPHSAHDDIWHASTTDKSRDPELAIRGLAGGVRPDLFVLALQSL